MPLFSKQITTLIEEQVNNDFVHVCMWVLDYQLQIHFGKDETKLIRF